MQSTPPPSAADSPAPPPQPAEASRARSPASQPAGSRISNLARLVIAVAVIAAIILTVFCAQNTGPATVHFLGWSWPGAPLFAVILAAVALGFVIGAVFVWLRLVRYSIERRIPGRRRNRV